MIHFGGCAGQLPPFEWGVLPLPGLSHHSRYGDLYNLSNCLTIIYCVRRVDGAGGMVKTFGDMIHFGGCAGQLPPFEWGVLPLPGLSHHSRYGDLYNLSNCLTIIYCVRRVDGAGGMVKICSVPVRTPLLFVQTELCHVVSRACALHTTWSHAPRGPRACALCYHLGDSIFVHQQWACRISVIASSCINSGRAGMRALAPCVNYI